MDLLSPTYLIFVLAGAFLFQICPARWRGLFLCLISVIFFSMFSVISAAVMVGLTLLVFLTTQSIEKYRNSRTATLLLWLNIVLGISYVIFFKAVPLLGIQGNRVPVAHFLAGFGASYYTFKLISYTIDVYWGKKAASRKFSPFLAAISFFPQLPAGPIQRVSEFKLPENRGEFAELMPFGCRRILLAFLKKMAIADPLGGVVGMIGGNPAQFQHQFWIAFYLYPVQLYADFSALTDLAIGIAALFGIRSPENFNLPFFASSISQFWRRWHMTLTRWLTDYVFSPLRMATRRLGKAGLAISLTLNMILIGFWHGLNSGFLCFGLIHAAFLNADAFSRNLRGSVYDRYPRWERAMRVVGPIVTYHLVAFSLVWFYNPVFGTGLYFCRHLLSGVSHPLSSLAALMYAYERHKSLLAFLGLFLLILLDVATYLRASSSRVIRAIPRFAELPAALRWGCYYAAVMIILFLHRQNTQFIYVQF